jgi:transposase
MVAMPAPISIDLRRRIFECRQAGESTAEVAERFAVCPAFVRRLMQRFRETGSLAAKSGPRGRKPLLAPHAERIRELNAHHPDLTAAEIHRRLGLTTSVLTVWKMLRRLGLTFKKSRSAPPSRTAPTCSKRASTGRNSSNNSCRDG